MMLYAQSTTGDDIRAKPRETIIQRARNIERRGHRETGTLRDRNTERS